MSFWRSTWPKARKPYKCEGCRASIAVGEYHASHAGMSDGDFYAYRLCRPCDDLIDYLSRTIPTLDEGVDLANLYDEAAEALGEEHASVVALKERQDAAQTRAPHQHGAGNGEKHGG